MSARGLIKKVIPSGVFRRVEPAGHLTEAILENIVYGFPAKDLKVIGITGTAGKSTTCALVYHMLKENGYKVGLMTTISIDYGDGSGLIHNTTRMTSVGSLKLLQAVKRMKANGVEWLVLETTSHALAQHRVWGVPYSIVAFTNLSPDNLEYHGTFERYRRAKLRLFEQANRNRKGQRLGLVNTDDPSGKYFVRTIKNPISYGLNSGDLRATNIKLAASGSSFEASLDGQSYKIRTNLPGQFNIYNCLAAIGVTRAAGLNKTQIEKSIASLPSVEGRMNSIDEGQDFTVIVDYAPTPEAFTQVYAAVKPLTKAHIITVFGSAGRRDTLKRPIQGEIAGKNSDIVILTEEDDRDQDGLQIIKEIAKGAEKAGKVKDKTMFFVHEREQAVQKAIDMARKDDIVLLLGKGEETVIVTNKPGFKPSPNHVYNEATDTIRREYNETAAARAALKNRLGK